MLTWPSTSLTCSISRNRAFNNSSCFFGLLVLLCISVGYIAYLKWGEKEVNEKKDRVPVDKIFIEQNSPEPKVKVIIPMYEPSEVTRCEKCGKVLRDPKMI